MNNKSYIWLGVGAVIIIAVIYLLVSSSAPSTGTQTNNGTGVNTGINTGKQGDSVKTGKTTSINDAQNTPAGANTPTSVQDKVPAKENVISVDGATFSPKNLEVAADSKVFLTFSAKDAKKHTFAFEADDLSYITVAFNKTEGDKSVTFPAPKPGVYSFYVDTKDNKGTMTVK